MDFKPTFDNVIVEQMKQEQTTASGIVLPGSDKEKPMCGKVVAVGSGEMPDGKNNKMFFKVGQEVIYSKYSGSEVEIDKVKYVILKQNDIQAVK